MVWDSARDVEAGCERAERAVEGDQCPEDSCDVACLGPEVEFLGEGVGETAAQLGDVVGAGPRRAVFQPARQPADHLEVPGDQLIGAGPLHLEDDLVAAVAAGRVRLRE